MSANQSRASFVLLFLAAVLALLHFFLASYHTLLIGFADIDVFLYTTWGYLKTGELYMDTEPLARTYEAGRSVLKFPPLYIIPYLPWIDPVNGINHSIYKLLFSLHVIRYIASFLLVGFFLGPYKNIFWWMLLIIVFSLCAPFYEALYGLTFDNIFLFLLVLSLVFIKFRKTLPSIFLLTYAANLKIYPVIQLLPFLLKRNWKMFLICFVCAGMWLGISLAVFGFSPHEFYFFHILPVLFQEQTLCETGNVSITAQFCSYSFFISFLKLFFIIATLGISIFVTKTTIKNFAQESLLFSFVLCLPLILMKNVWGNYQIVLLIPIAVLLAYSFEKKGMINYLPGIIALLAWLPLIASDNYPAMNIPYYFLIDGKIARMMIDHLKAYSAMVLWAELAYLLIKQKKDKI